MDANEGTNKIRRLEPAGLAEGIITLAGEEAHPRLRAWLSNLVGFLDCSSRLNIVTSQERLQALLLILQAAREGKDPHDSQFTARKTKKIAENIRKTRITKEDRLEFICRELRQQESAAETKQKEIIAAALENFCFQLAFEEETLALDALLAACRA